MQEAGCFSCFNHCKSGDHTVVFMRHENHSDLLTLMSILFLEKKVAAGDFALTKIADKSEGKNSTDALSIESILTRSD